MKIAHLADTHIGFRQFGIEEREEDFLRAFERAIEEILQRGVRLVLHSGDLMESPMPRLTHLNFLYMQFKRLRDAGIPIFGILGNHDRPRVSSHLSTQRFFHQMGMFHLLSEDENPDWTVWNDVFIAGISFREAEISEDSLSFWEEAFALLEEQSRPYPVRLLMLHQGISGLIPPHLPAELPLEILPKNFHYIALGHIHFPKVEKFGGGFIVYPGSLELWRWEELRNPDFGFYIVDVGEDKVEVERVGWAPLRPMFRRTLHSVEEIPPLLAEVASLPVSPVVEISYPLSLERELRTHSAFAQLRSACVKLITKPEIPPPSGVAFQALGLSEEALLREFLSRQNLVEEEVETLWRLGKEVLFLWQEDKEACARNLRDFLNR
ncbi:MAG: metallophosphoesterase family protein [bacterium JZ-2024 1]